MLVEASFMYVGRYHLQNWYLTVLKLLAQLSPKSVKLVEVVAQGTLSTQHHKLKWCLDSTSITHISLVRKLGPEGPPFGNEDHSARPEDCTKDPRLCTNKSDLPSKGSELMAFVLIIRVWMKSFACEHAKQREVMLCPVTIRPYNFSIL